MSPAYQFRWAGNLVCNCGLKRANVKIIPFTITVLSGIAQVNKKYHHVDVWRLNKKPIFAPRYRIGV